MAMEWLTMAISENRPTMMALFETREEAQSAANEYLEEFYPGAPRIDDEMFEDPKHTEENADVLLECDEMSIGIYNLGPHKDGRNARSYSDEPDDDDEDEDEDPYDFEDPE